MKKSERKRNLSKNKKNNRVISKFSIERLLLYSKTLEDVKKRKKQKKILSSEVGSILNLDATQVRKDLSYVGKLGKRGAGYFIDSLLKTLNSFLYRNKKIRVCIIGVGKLGAALMGYKIFRNYNIDIIAGFDVDKHKIGRKINNIMVYDIKYLTRIINSKRIKVGVITTPVEVAYNIAEMLKEAKIKAIINFAPVYINFYDMPIVDNIDLSIFFEIVRYKVYQNL